MATMISTTLSSPAAGRAGQSGSSGFKAFWREFLRHGLPPLPARTALHARSRPCLARQVRRSGRLPPEAPTSEGPTSNAFLKPRDRLRAPLRATMATFPDGAFAAVILAMNGPSNDAAALCNSRRLFQAFADLRGLVQNHGPGRPHRVRKALQVRGRGGLRAEGFPDHPGDARAHARFRSRCSRRCRT